VQRRVAKQVIVSGFPHAFQEVRESGVEDSDLNDDEVEKERESGIFQVGQ